MQMCLEVAFSMYCFIRFCVTLLNGRCRNVSPIPKKDFVSMQLWLWKNQNASFEDLSLDLYRTICVFVCDNTADVKR